jgi:hypothetical protein
METMLELRGGGASFSHLFAAQPEIMGFPGGAAEMISVAGAPGGLRYPPGISYTETCLRLAGPNGARLQSA